MGRAGPRAADSRPEAAHVGWRDNLENIDLGEYASLPAAVSAVTVAELAYGLNVPGPIDRHARTERSYEMLGKFEVPPFDVTAASFHGTLGPRP